MTPTPGAAEEAEFYGPGRGIRKPRSTARRGPSGRPSPPHPMIEGSGVDAPTVTARRRALIVMPDGPVRSAVARILRGAGAVVTAASDPFEATARFAEAPADLVIAATAGW